ncbi:MULTISPECIES: hypothetical protein [Mycobacterium]|uniref:Nitroreductase family deazaflavin-dependent oxidoreductase n=1 Tax=Mycobacterium colombiense TaxID=339268 RepID=A0A329M2Y1_9MYCO|nr:MULTISPECIES: hypothetical protein [Mycobacterium]MDM4138818.1 hypothetical protein [Mycobacterium sp. FLAC0960]RAV14100.1 hypothetical protein DQP57_06985 [Mycobacterium colombiense]
MTEQSYAVDAGHPPSALMRLVNPMMGFLLRSPLASLVRNQFMVLSFTGRKTGRAYSIPLSAHVIDGELYALTGNPWKQNFRDGGPVQVVYAGKMTAMRGELIRDRAVVSDLLVRCAESYGVQRAQRMIGLKFRDQRIPSRDEFAEAVDRLHLGAVRLSPAP